jgi:predicted nuclease of predicted toxin-antitoxin system
VKQRWLLDHNIPKQLVEWLRGKGVAAETAFELAWRDLDDAQLLKRASRSHTVLLTRDKRFAEAAGFPTVGKELAIVIL